MFCLYQLVFILMGFVDKQTHVIFNFDLVMIIYFRYLLLFN